MENKICRDLWWHAGKYLTKMMDETRQRPSGESPSLTNLIPFFGFVAAIFAVIGAEAEKLIFREGIGRSALNRFNIALCIVGFIVAGYYSSEVNLHFWGYDNSFLSNINFGFMILLALLILVKGIAEWRHGNENLNSNGIPKLLRFLKKYNWSDERIKYVAEPICLIIFGAAYLRISFISGIIFASCGVSVWLHAVLEMLARKYLTDNSLPPSNPPTAFRVVK